MHISHDFRGSLEHPFTLGRKQVYFSPWTSSVTTSSLTFPAACNNQGSHQASSGPRAKIKGLWYLHSRGLPTHWVTLPSSSRGSHKLIIVFTVRVWASPKHTQDQFYHAHITSGIHQPSFTLYMSGQVVDLISRKYITKCPELCGPGNSADSNNRNV